MDWQTEIYKSISEHLPLVVGLSVAAWWGFPKMLKNTLLNGGGEIIRSIVRQENDAQSLESEKRMEILVKEAISAHELVEQQKTTIALANLKAEITDRYEIPKNRRRAK